MLSQAEHDRPRVLVVDDLPDTLQSTATLLNIYGYNVKTACGGAEAIARSLEFRPEVVLLDLAMPHMDGFETARRIQALDLPPPPPVLVAVSGNDDRVTRRQAAEAGFDLHLVKPVHPRLLGQIQVLLDDTRRIGEKIAELDIQNQETRRNLAFSYVQMGRSMLQVIATTENKATRERCVSKARLICDRLGLWINRYPYLTGIRVQLEDLIRRLPRI